MSHSIVAGRPLGWHRCDVNSVLAVRDNGPNLDGCGVRYCTTFRLGLSGEKNSLLDCMMPSVQSAEPSHRISNCCVCDSVAFIDAARPDEGCFGGGAQFVDPEHYDDRLRPTSPCRGRASDGGDLGFRYTPALVELMNFALALRARGIIKF